MRIRQVKPSFWSDAKVAELSERTRLFYIGLWMIADDAGWLRWDASEVAHDLYGYESRPKRERRAGEMFAELTRAARVVLHPCGHAEVPKLSSHQHLSVAAKQVRTVLNEHLRDCFSTVPATPRGNPPMPVETRPVNGKERVMEGNGTVSEGKGTARAPDGARFVEPTEFQRLVPRPLVRPA